jgi:hypothetical protein
MLHFSECLFREVAGNGESTHHIFELIAPRDKHLALLDLVDRLLTGSGDRHVECLGNEVGHGDQEIFERLFVKHRVAKRCEADHYLLLCE